MHLFLKPDVKEYEFDQVHQKRWYNSRTFLKQKANRIFDAREKIKGTLIKPDAYFQESLQKS